MSLLTLFEIKTTVTGSTTPMRGCEDSALFNLLADRGWILVKGGGNRAKAASTNKFLFNISSVR